MGILGPTDPSRRRPGDVSLPHWRDGRGLAIDVAVISSLAHMGCTDPCESYAVDHKHRRYGPSFVGSPYDFVPVVFEASGAVNAEGEEILRQLIRFAAVRSGSGLSRFAGRAWARISCCIQNSVAQSVLNRTPPADLERSPASSPSSSSPDRSFFLFSGFFFFSLVSLVSFFRFVFAPFFPS